MPKPKPNHEKDIKPRVSINAVLYASAEKLAARRGQAIWEMVTSLLERELHAHGIDPYATAKPAGGKTAASQGQ